MAVADERGETEGVGALLEHPLLRGLTASDLHRLAPHLVRDERKRGEYVFRRGDPGDALYVILAGQVAIENRLEGRAPLLALCGPGEWFGELALLTGGARSADARVEVDATLLCIDRSGWAELSVQAPGVFGVLCERLSRQLGATNLPAPRARRSVVACLDASGWLTELVQSLEHQFPSRTLHRVGPGASRAEAARALAAVGSRDALVLLAGGDELAELADRSVRREGPDRFTITPAGTGRTQRVRASQESPAIDRLARHLAGGVIGLALGAGGAYGLSHLGLLGVLAEAGIPVDCVAGTSMGAIVAAAFTAGVRLANLEALAARVARDYAGLVLRDLDLRGPALLRGDAPARLLRELGPMSAARCEELVVPFAAVAMDLRTGEAVELRSGPLLDAIRPSYAMPVIFPPCVRGERILVDGAMACPVPVEVARSLGADFVIAAQPIPPLAAAESGDTRSGLRRVLEWIPLGRVQHSLRTLDVSVRSFQALWHRLASAAVARADAAIEPELAAYSFLQFGAGPEIVAAGRRAAESALPNLRARLSEAVGWAGSRAAPGARSASSS